MKLEVCHISKNFGAIKALDDVSFEVEAGKVTALLGENGAGKSTLFRLIAGFYEPDAGEIVLNGLKTEQNRTKYLKMIGYVPEISSLYGEMSVYDFLHFVAQIRGLPKAICQDKIAEVVAKMALQNVLWQKNETLSKGYKKRVELAAALLAEPELLLLDEPTEGLDPNQKQVLRQIIADYAEKHMVIISTHMLEDVEVLASHILLIHKGKLSADTDLAQFKKTAGNDLLRSFQQVTEN